MNKEITLEEALNSLKNIKTLDLHISKFFNAVYINY